MITKKNKFGIGNYLNIKIKDHYPPTGDQVVAFPSFVTDNRNLKHKCGVNKSHGGSEI